jgi:hypothetical protein
VNPLLSKLIAPIKQFFHREDWKNLVGGWGVCFAIFVLPWILGFWYPSAFGFGYMTFLLLIILLLYGFYTEAERKIDAGEPTYKVTYLIFKSMKFIGEIAPKLAEGLGQLLAGIFGLILLIAVVGGVLGILVFGWKQLL